MSIFFLRKRKPSGLKITPGSGVWGVVIFILKFILIEIRDWFFAICGLLAMIVVPQLFDNWWLAVGATIGVGCVYLLVVFCSDRWFKIR